MRGGNDAHVDLDGVRVADALELPFLENAQQLGLQRRAHGSDLVQEQRALVRLLDASLAGADRPGKGAPCVTEQLGFEQRLRDRAAVQGHEPVGPPGAVVVDRPRRQFLARPGFTGDEHRARRRGHGFQQLEQVAHHAAAPDQAIDAISILELRSQVGVLRFQPPLFDGGAQDVQQRIELEWLGNEVGGALFDRVYRVLHRPVSGNDDGDDVRDIVRAPHRARRGR